jgi:transcriptional regulator GlxA family with amidase domain
MLGLRWLGGRGLADLSRPGRWFDRDGHIRHQVEWMLDLVPAQNPAALSLAGLLTRTALAELRRLQDPVPDELAVRIRRFVHSRISQRITLDDLAREARMSKYHFSRTFKRLTGQTPMRMVNQIRLQTARQLLLGTDLKLAAIAARVGLVDASHLSHLFRRSLGVSPGTLRHRP